MPPARSHLVAVASVALCAAALTGCNANADRTSAAADDGRSLILVTPEPVGVNPFLQLAVKGVEDAAAQHGASSKVFQSQDATTVQQQVEAAVAEQPDVLAVVGFEFADSIAAAATANPEQQFLFVDACTTEQFPNVTCAVFREHEGTFLAGVEAGLLTTTNEVGAVVALDTPQIRRFSDPFGAGAAHVNPQVSFTPLYVGGPSPFNDPARAKEQALSLAAQSVDQIIASSAAGNLGVFDAAKQSGFSAYGVDVDQCGLAPGQVVDNVIKEVDRVTADGVDKILAGQGGTTVSYGLAEGGVTLTGLEEGLAQTQCVIAQHPDVVAEIEKVRDQIISGEVRVDDPAGV
jgi:basic membrane protein A